MNTYSRNTRIAIVMPYFPAAWLAVSQNGVAHRETLCDWIEAHVALTGRDRRWLFTTMNDIAHDLRHGLTFQLAGQPRQLRPDSANTTGKQQGYLELH